GGSITLESIRISAPSDVPLALLVFPGEPFALQLEYDTGRYSPAMARRLLRCTARALEGLARPDTRTAAEVDVLDPQDRETLASWSRSPVSEPPVRDVLDLFDQAVRATPDAPAVRDPSTTLTYAELDEAANRLAHRVLRESPEAEHLLGIPADPVAGSIVSILACLKAGRGYVTFDPDQPETRLRQILEHTHRVLARGLDGARTSAIDTRGLDGEPATPPSVERREDRIAYAVFTSGSTGKPKGVVVERGALARSTCARLAWYDTSPGRFLLLSSLAVDSSVAGLYWTLCTGGCLVLPPSRAEQDVAGLGALMKREAVSTTLLVPGLYQALLEGVDPTRLESLDCVVVAGDVCPASLVAHHHRRLPGVRLVNEYGPSEATVWATAGDLETGDEARITIGRPVPFVRLYLLDDAGRRVPPGASGEICLGGDTLARGYLGTDTPDSDRFVADPFRRGGRLYRTGDRGRFREDGRLEFLGRLDHQLKIRGFRVEPGEIERVLQSAPGVVEAAVVRADPATPEVDDLVEALLERAGDDAENLLNRLLERA
ncbi:MAG: amino acid adenylation domain-containing protein, partial [Gemmatimonadota bacterium]